MTLYVDPPEGWRYGFPKAVPKEWETQIFTWLLKEGYPPEIVKKMGNNFAVRCWREEEKDNG